MNSTKNFTDTVAVLPDHEILYVGFDRALALRVKAWAVLNGHTNITIDRKRVPGSRKSDKLFHYTVVSD